MKGGKRRSSGGGGSSSSEAVQPPLDGDDTAATEAEEERLRQGVDGEREDGGEEGEEEREEEEDQEGYEQFEGFQIEDVEAEANRPKLAEGFYEIEAVRKRRVRKGEVQYLIKWRGWPETANTWEPLENLQSCSDVIDAYEERFSRKRKRKSVVSHPQTKKKQECSPPADTYSIPKVKVRVIEEPMPFAVLNDSGILNERENNVTSLHNVQTENQAIDNGFVMVSPRVEERKEESGLDLKLTELNGAFSTERNGFKVALNGQEACTLEGDHQSKIDSAEPVQAGRCTGAKRRKSGSVKRFKQDSTSSVVNDMKSGTARNTNSQFGWQGIQNAHFVGDDLDIKNKFDNPRNTCTITEIIRPMSYSSSKSEDVKDVTVTFMAMRSDGKEVMVDNKFLKANNPILLINFYEEHLQYKRA